MATPESAEKMLREIVSSVFKKPIDEIRLESKFRDDLGADSLDLIVLLHELEDRFDVAISDEDARKIVTVGDAVKLALELAPK